MNHFTTLGWVHMGFAAFGLVAAAVQLLRPKGDRIHRALGYAYVYGMIFSNATALLLYRFTGSFNVFHAGAIVNFACIIAAMIPALRTPRAPDWLAKHYRWMAASYIGLAAAASTEVSVRVLPLGSRGAVWLVAGLAIAIVSAVGSLLIRRNRPPQLRGADSATTL